MVSVIDLINPRKDALSTEGTIFIRLFISAEQHSIGGSGKEYTCNIKPLKSQSLKVSLSSVSHYGSYIFKSVNKVDVIPYIKPNDGLNAIEGSVKINYISKSKFANVMQLSFLYVESRTDLEITCHSNEIDKGPKQVKSTERVTKSIIELTTNKQNSGSFTESINKTENNTNKQKRKSFSLGIQVLFLRKKVNCFYLILNIFYSNRNFGFFNNKYCCFCYRWNSVYLLCLRLCKVKRD